MSDYPQEWKERLIGIVLAEEGKRDNAKIDLVHDVGKSKRTIERWLAELTREVFRDWLRTKEAEPSSAESPTLPTSSWDSFARYAANLEIKRLEIEVLRKEVGRAMLAGDYVSAKEILCILDPPCSKS